MSREEDAQRGRGLTRRSLLLAVPAGAALAFLASCAGPAPLPARRIMGIGYEDVIGGAARLRELARQLDAAGINEVGIAAGRVDWTLFPWREREDAWSAEVSDGDGADLLAEAIDALRPAADGSQRELTIVVDVLAPRTIADRPELAGVSIDGTSSEEFPGLAALTRGAVADEIITLVGEIAARYAPSAISLTELFLDDTTYGDEDLRDFQRVTGERDWPRTGGSIDAEDERIVRWRCEAIAELVAHAREAAAAHGAELWMEVRAPREKASADRRDSGHDYELLTGAADRLVMWDYFGIAEDGGPGTRSLARALSQRDDGRGVLSVGLWDDARDAITPAQLRSAVEDAARGGSQAVWVTPVSLMSQEHWRALADAWQASSR